MSRSNKSYRKREPKNKSDFRGSGVDPACCGMTCCGWCRVSGYDVVRRCIRQVRRVRKATAIREGLSEVED